MDEFEIEVTDLRPTKGTAGPPATSHTDEPPDTEPPDELSHAPLLPLTRLRPAVAAGLRGRGRQLRGLGVALALLLTALIVLTSVPTSREALIAALNIPTPVPTATLAEGADLIFFTHDVPWGELTIDGKARPAPRPVRQNGVTPYTLSRGQHTVAFRAAPFPTLRCRISVPADAHDTCPLDISQQQDGGNPFLNTVRTIDLGAVPSRLSPDDRASLITAANRLLARQQTVTTVQPGEPYLTSDSTPTTAQQPLRAALIATLATPGGSSVFVGNGQCAPFCDEGFGGPDTSPGGWPVLAQVSTTWRYTFPDGNTAEGAGTTSAAGGSSAAVNFVPLSVIWRDGSGGWDVSLSSPSFSGNGAGGPFGSFVCGLANADYSTLTPDQSSPLSQSASFSCLTAQNPADGCVIAVTPVGPNGGASSTISDKTALFLYRFGLLYAVNDQAHQAASSLVTANASQQALAQQIVKDNGDG
jgi:hypothetical protein